VGYWEAKRDALRAEQEKQQQSGDRAVPVLVRGLVPGPPPRGTAPPVKLSRFVSPAFYKPNPRLASLGSTGGTPARASCRTSEPNGIVLGSRNKSKPHPKGVGTPPAQVQERKPAARSAPTDQELVCSCNPFSAPSAAPGHEADAAVQLIKALFERRLNQRKPRVRFRFHAVVYSAGCPGEGGGGASEKVLIAHEAALQRAVVEAEKESKKAQSNGSRFSDLHATVIRPEPSLCSTMVDPYFLEDIQSNSEDVWWLWRTKETIDFPIRCGAVHGTETDVHRLPGG